MTNTEIKNSFSRNGIHKNLMDIIEEFNKLPESKKLKFGVKMHELSECLINKGYHKGQIREAIKDLKREGYISIHNSDGVNIIYPVIEKITPERVVYKKW